MGAGEEMLDERPVSCTLLWGCMRLLCVLSHVGLTFSATLSHLANNLNTFIGLPRETLGGTL